MDGWHTPGDDTVPEPAWLRDDIAPTPMPEPERREKRPAKRRRRGPIIAAVGILAVVGAGVVLALRSVESPSNEPETAAAATEPEDDSTWCGGLGAGVVAAVDSDDPGVAVIAAFERAYYVLRDGNRARDQVASDARVGSAEQISKGIAQIPVGTNHCVLVRNVTDGVYAVDIYERRPDSTGAHYPQTVFTAATPNGTKITAITTRDE